MGDRVLYELLPECDKCGASEAKCFNSILQKGYVKCCPDCRHRVPVEPDYEAVVEPVAELISFIYTMQVMTPQEYHDAVDGFLHKIVDAALGLEADDGE